MTDLFKKFEDHQPEIVFEWKDPETEAEGCLVVNSLRGGAAGGGTRMRAGLGRSEVESLAKTMEVKFTVSGPQIGGAKSGINFDPNDPRRRGVLERWYRAVRPFLKAYYGTGGDLNVDQALDVIPITRGLGVLHPQEGIVRGHFGSSGADLEKRIRNLQEGVMLRLTDPTLSPDPSLNLTVADMITGWGVAEAVRHHYQIQGGSHEGKRVIVQGWGNVGAAAGYYMAQSGASVVGIIDLHGGLISEGGFTFDEIRNFFLDRDGKRLKSARLIPIDVLLETVWDVPADVFLPCAASKLITSDQIARIQAAGVAVISPGANVPFADDQVYLGPTGSMTDRSLSLVPDFIANCGMARVFAYLMEADDVEVSGRAIFDDTSQVIHDALRAIHDKNPSPLGITRSALEIAFGQLV